MTEGTTRTLKWMAGGFRALFGGGSSNEPSVPAQRIPTAPDKTLSDRLADRPGHSQRTIGLAVGVAHLPSVARLDGLRLVRERQTAAIGVLISWPAALAAVMLVTAPFIGGAVAVRRHRAGEPVFAGAVAPAEPSAEPAPR